jgi:MFS family permease
MALPGLILAAAFLFMRDYRTVPLPVPEGETGRNLWISARGLFGIPSLVWTWLAFTCNFACTTPLMAWIPSYLNRFHGLDEQKAGMMAGLLALLALVGAPLGGLLADLWSRRQPNARLYLCGATSLLSALLLALTLLLSQTVFFAPLLVLFGIFSVAFLGPGQAIIQDVVHPGLRALAYGINVFSLQLLGSSWTPWLVGALSDRWDLEQALLLLPLFSVAAGLFFIFGVKHYRSDAGRVQDVVLLEES